MTDVSEIPRCPKCDEPLEFCDCHIVRGLCCLCEAECSTYDFCYGCKLYVCGDCDALAQLGDPQHDDHLPQPHVAADHLPPLQPPPTPPEAIAGTSAEKPKAETDDEPSEQPQQRGVE